MSALDTQTLPDAQGHFGAYGGRYVAETLMPLILELEQAYEASKKDPAFQAELKSLNTHYAGRPSPLYFAERLTRHLGGFNVAYCDGHVKWAQWSRVWPPASGEPFEGSFDPRQ